MLETNATFILAKVRQDTRYQVIDVLKRYNVTNFDYSESGANEPGEPIVGRFELTIPDAAGVDVQRLMASLLRAATGYQPPDASVVASRVYFANNAM